ncbi:cupin domain-containing protein [Thermovirga sp.]|uniref:cupin domain-containing protein n=1 Tax=Thermovirga sp. TaxID=2699834 RepID=UPI0025F7661C|nr:cupin domain-containing protein [Thermovirga sp.]MBO8154067.1 cupin domain-containing protein [Thermovirga sp.]
MRKEGKKMANEDNVFAGSIESLESVAVKEAWGVEKKIVFGPRRFWKDYVMRHFQLDKGAQTPLHTHDWPHYVVILSGKVEFVLNDHSYILDAHSWAYVPSGEKHCFKNLGDSPLNFLCTVPVKGDPEA